VALAATTIEGGRRGFADPVVLGGFGLTAVALGAFVLVESRRAGVRRAEPMLPLGLFRSRAFASISAVGLLVNIAFYGLIFLLGLYFQTIRHYSALATGLAFAPSTAAVLVANLGAGRLTRAFGNPQWY